MTAKPRVFFRADGGSKTGMGHIFRLLALAEMLSGYFECHFIIREPSETIQKYMLEICQSIITIPEDIPFEKEAKWCSKLVENNTDIFVLDGYKFESSYQQILKDAEISLVCIDDIYAHHFYADAVVNHAPGISADQYSLAENTTFCGGLDYAVIRSKFLDLAKKDRKIHEFKKLFICFGGSDFNNLSTRVLSLLAEKIPTAIREISVVIGEANIHKKEVEQASLAFDDVKINLLYNLSADEMIAEMQDAQVAILPSSTILYEAIAVKMPIISGYYVDNQESVYHGFNQLGLIYGVGNINTFNDYYTLLNQIILTNPQSVIDKQGQHLDGSSRQRFRNLFLTISKKYNIRAANSSDMETYFRWANDPEVRKNAISNDPIKLESHISWFNKKLNDKNSCMYVLYCNGKAVGQVRFDIENNVATIDYSIDHNFRGKGLGKVLITLGISQAEKDLNEKITFKALVKKQNIASNKVFENIGFHLAGNQIINDEFYNVFRLTNSY